VEPDNVPAVLALGAAQPILPVMVAPMNGPQEVDGPIIPVDPQEMADVPLLGVQSVGQNNHFLTMWR
jgi:hypothetical protein